MKILKYSKEYLKIVELVSNNNTITFKHLLEKFALKCKYLGALFPFNNHLIISEVAPLIFLFKKFLIFNYKLKINRSVFVSSLVIPLIENYKQNFILLTCIGRYNYIPRFCSLNLSVNYKENHGYLCVHSNLQVFIQFFKPTAIDQRHINCEIYKISNP